MNESEIVAKFVADINALHGNVLTESDIQALLNNKLGRKPVYVVQYNNDGTYVGGGYRGAKVLAHARIFKQRHWAEYFAKQAAYRGGATIKEVTLTLV